MGKNGNGVTASRETSRSDPLLVPLPFNDFPIDDLLPRCRRPGRQVPALLLRALLLLVRPAGGQGLDGGLPAAGCAPRLLGTNRLRWRPRIRSVPSDQGQGFPQGQGRSEGESALAN